MTTSSARERAPVPIAPALRSILVPLDGSAESEWALSVAADLARHAGATLHLVRVAIALATDDAPPPGGWEDAQRQEIARYLDAAATAAARAGLVVEHSGVSGEIVPELLREAERVEADLVVMSTHGRTGLRRAVLGSVADGVSRHSRVPVLLVRFGAAAAPVASFGRVLVALDGSPEAERVLSPAMMIARACGSAVELVRVVHPISLTADDFDLGPAESAETYLSALAEQLLQVDAVDIQPRIVVSDNIAQAILAEAAESEVDLVAITSHGRGASRLFIGSVADAVLRGGVRALLLSRIPR